MAHVFFPVPPEELTQMCRQGFDDTLKFLQKNGKLWVFFVMGVLYEN